MILENMIFEIFLNRPLLAKPKGFNLFLTTQILIYNGFKG